jgi:hypothetical protein
MKLTLSHPTTRAANIRLWTVQSLLAALFLFAGGMKFAMPIDVLAQQSHMSGVFIRFIGVCEVLGAFGLVLPGLFRIKTELTALAASGLVIIMIGATTITFAQGQVGGAIVPFVVGVLATVVARGRWQWSPTAARASVEPVTLRRAA